MDDQFPCKRKQDHRHKTNIQYANNFFLNVIILFMLYHVKICMLYYVKSQLVTARMCNNIESLGLISVMSGIEQIY